MRLNDVKSTKIAFSKSKGNCPSVSIKGHQLDQMPHIDISFFGRKHISVLKNNSNHNGIYQIERPVKKLKELNWPKQIIHNSKKNWTKSSRLHFPFHFLYSPSDLSCNHVTENWKMKLIYLHVSESCHFIYTKYRQLKILNANICLQSYSQ